MSFKFSMNAYGYDVIWRDSARWLGFVWRDEGGWSAKTADGRRIMTPCRTRNDAAWELFRAAG
jgi:hypothetical protein